MSTSTPDASSTSRRPRGLFYVVFTGVFALLIAIVLQASAAAKLHSPNKKLWLIEPDAEAARFAEGVYRDTAIGIAELALVVLVLLLHRLRITWAGVLVFFAGLTGYAAYAFLNDMDCGCFGVRWTPPKGMTLAIDIVFVLGALGVLLASRAHKAILTLALIGGLAAGGLGVYQAHQDNQLTQETVAALPGTPIEILLASDEFAGVSVGEPMERLHYFFVGDPDCDVCQMLKPLVELDAETIAAEQWPASVRVLDVNDLATRFGIPNYAWQTTPTVFAVDAGVVVYYETGEQVQTPMDLVTAWFAGQELGGRDPAEDFGLVE